jgi:hypothetical protein
MSQNKWEETTLGFLIVEMKSGKWYWDRNSRSLMFISNDDPSMIYVHDLSRLCNTREKIERKVGRIILAGQNSFVNPGDTQW